MYFDFTFIVKSDEENSEYLLASSPMYLYFYITRYIWKILISIDCFCVSAYLSNSAQMTKLGVFRSMYVPTYIQYYTVYHITIPRAHVLPVRDERV